MTDSLPQKAEQTAPVKRDDKPKRFVEKGRDVVFDSKTRVYWLKKDSWQDKGKFFNWHEAVDYSDKKNLRKIGGYDDWRLPNEDEVTSLYDESCENPGKGGVILNIDPVFPEGAFKTEWIAGDTSTRRPRFDYSEGKIVFVEEYSFGSVRICRKDKVIKDQSRPRRR
ncbi:MAG: DUF1566 domain-containing protein [Nitrospina sp.]|jgi:hypothetical protein|nr:DUF1566 domain-containing protein [Nitrospina sp.]